MTLVDTTHPHTHVGPVDSLEGLQFACGDLDGPGNERVYGAFDPATRQFAWPEGKVPGFRRLYGEGPSQASHPLVWEEDAEEVWVEGDWFKSKNLSIGRPHHGSYMFHFHDHDREGYYGLMSTVDAGSFAEAVERAREEKARYEAARR